MSDFEADFPNKDKNLGE